MPPTRHQMTKENRRVEYAKSNRSMCTTCKGSIPEGALRIGTPYDYKGTAAFRWSHPGCCPPLSVDIMTIDGIRDIRDADVDALRLVHDGIPHTPGTNDVEALQLMKDKVRDTRATNDVATKGNTGGVYVLELNQKGRYYVGMTECIERRVAEHTAGGERCASWVKSSGGVARVLEAVTPRAEILVNWEMNETLTLMMKHGFNNVRGFEWTRTQDLKDEEILSIRGLCCGMGGLCRRCGLPGHMITDCATKPSEMADWMIECSSQCSQQKAPQTLAGTMQAIATKRKAAPPMKTAPSKKAARPTKAAARFNKASKTAQRASHASVCQRCGRHGHSAGRCWAKVDRGGNEIVDEDTSDSSDDEDICFRCGRGGHRSTSCYAKRDVHGATIRS